jgi:hypothetical protein
MSFYLTLSSDGCKDTFPRNHGGDFKIQLEHTLDMRGSKWEVALVEMMYTGQAFPNLSIEDSEVRLRACGKPIFENDYIITYDETFQLWISLKSERRLVPQSTKTTNIYLPKQHYSWSLFVETLKRLCFEQFNIGMVDLNENEFQFSEKNLTLDKLFNMSMSDTFIEKFGIDKKYKQIHDHNGRWVHFKHKITKIPKPVDDSSLCFYSPFAENKNCSIHIGDELIFRLTNQYWTVNMFKRAINTIGKHLDKSSWLSSLSIEEGRSAQECTMVLTANKNGRDVTVTLSNDFKTVFGTVSETFTLSFTEPLKIQLLIAKAEDENLPWKTFVGSKRLKNNYYPDISSLVKELNEAVAVCNVDIANQRMSSTVPHAFFDVHQDVVKFSGKEGFTVLLSTNLLKMMHLPSSWLINSVTGTQAVVMKSYRRSHFYIHLDCLDYHYINNNVSDLLKIVPNNAAIDEKLQLTFSDPHYYTVAKRYLSTINMYVTDNYFDGMLQFDRDIAYTLHFRQCHSL